MCRNPKTTIQTFIRKRLCRIQITILKFADRKRSDTLILRNLQTSALKSWRESVMQSSKNNPRLSPMREGHSSKVDTGQHRCLSCRLRLLLTLSQPQVYPGWVQVLGWQWSSAACRRALNVCRHSERRGRILKLFVFLSWALQCRSDYDSVRLFAHRRGNERRKKQRVSLLGDEKPAAGFHLKTEGYN